MTIISVVIPTKNEENRGYGAAIRTCFETAKITNPEK